LKRHIDDLLDKLAKQFDTIQIEVGGIDFSVWKVHLQAKSYPEVGDEAVFYPDLNSELKVIPLNTLARKDRAAGLEDETEDEMEASQL
jgi:hypothetical protein